MTIKRLILTTFITMLLFSISLVTVVLLVFTNQKALIESYENRYQSYLLADQLRQSSDDLTRFARTYAITGDERYQQYYHDVLDIRDGKKPRPEEYERIYWDFFAARDVAPRRDGDTESLQSLMEKAGFDEAELAKLAQAEANSNGLVRTEEVAMHAIVGQYEDAMGDFTVSGTPDQQMASELLHNRDYHLEKERIMRPLDEFFVLLDTRTSGDVAGFLGRSDNLLLVLKVMAVALLLFSLGLSWLLVRIVLKPLGGEPVTMNHIANSISSGNLDLTFNDKATEGSVYHALKLMTANLRETSDASKQQAWLQEGMVSVSDVLRQERDVEVMSEVTLQVLARYVKAQAGSLYLWRDAELDDGQGLLERVATFAHMDVGRENRRYQLGQGLIGQAAAENNIVVIHDVPMGYLTLASGCGQAEPHSLALVPFSFRNELRGVIELGFLNPVDDSVITLLETLREPLGIAFENVTTRNTLSVALKDSQNLSEELQTQQEELRIMNESLRSKSSDLEAQKVALEQSQKDIQIKATELEQTSRYKSEFLANMSHELRTPLNSLLILARALAGNDEGNLSADEVESAEVIQDSGKHLLNLINDILDLSKVEAGKMLANDENIELTRLIRSLNHRFTPLATDKGISFSITREAEVPENFVSDYVRLEQVLTNLIGNGVKFTPEGAVSVRFSLQSDASGENWLAIAVSDTGIGIAEAQQENVFLAFQQADGSTTREFGGTGLGLSISREFARLLGGDIEVQSTPGQGSTFTLRIPARKTVLPAKTVSKQQVVATAEAGFEAADLLEPSLNRVQDLSEDDRHCLDASRPLFLIVEDDPKFARILYQTCHQQGVQALVAGDGETGLMLAKQYPVTGIVMDYMLPGMDGDDVISQLRADEATRHIPVHVMSALDNLADLSQRGADSQLVKPVTKKQIVDVLHQMYGASQPQKSRLLIVEDDAAGSLALQRLLKQDQLELDFVHTGNGALDAVTRQKYVAIILDLGLPDMTGFEVLRSLSDLPQEVLPQVIVHTGKELTNDEYLELSQYTDKIVIKSARSPERLLSEVFQFLNDVNSEEHAEVSAAVSAPVAAAELPETGSADKPADLSGRTALLVDDDMRNTFALAKVLRKQKMTVHIAPSGLKALELLDDTDGIELILMDIMMPEMDGYETIARIRDDSRYTGLPIIALTANAMPGDREKCLQAGADDYVSKPVDVQELMVHMQRLL